jgi:hypothetical protein
LNEETEVAVLRREFEKWREDESKRGWTMAKGVWAGVVPLIPLVVILFVWGSSVNEDRSLSKMEIAYLKKADERHESTLAEQKHEVVSRLDKLVEQMDSLKQSMTVTGKK